MAAKGTRVSETEKEKMWQLYNELGTFAEVAKKMRRDPGTVSRHVREYEARRAGAMCGAAAAQNL